MSIVPTDDQVLQYYNSTPAVYQVNTDQQPAVNTLTQSIVDKQQQLNSTKQKYTYGAFLSTLKNKTLDEQQTLLQSMEGIISNKSRIIQENETQLDYQVRKTQFIASIIVAFILLIPAGILFRIKPIAGYILLALIIIGLIVYYKYIWSGYQQDKVYNQIAYDTAQKDIDTRYQRELEEQHDQRYRQEHLAKLCKCSNPNIPTTPDQEEEESNYEYDPIFNVHRASPDTGFLYMDTSGPVEQISPPMMNPDAYGTVVQKYGGPVVTHHYTVQ